MSSPSPSRRTSPRRQGRPSPPPPGLLRGPGEVLEGAVILEEFSDPVGWLLWQTFRDVHLWVHTGPSERRRLFAAGALHDMLVMLQSDLAEPDLRALLVRLSILLLKDAVPADPERVAAECRCVAEWARQRAATGTALTFAQAAALATPDEPAPALETGILAAARGENARAESWLRRALTLARRAGDRATHARACLELGELFVRWGNPLLAARFYQGALRHGRRRGLCDVRSAALAGLARLPAASKVPSDSRRRRSGTSGEHGMRGTGPLS